MEEAICAISTASGSGAIAIVRVSGKDKDDLQAVIKTLRNNEETYNIPLQFQNYR